MKNKTNTKKNQDALSGVVGVRRLLHLLDIEFGITSHWGGNGCMCGFKPAGSCPNNCEEAKLQKLWDTIMENA